MQYAKINLFTLFFIIQRMDNLNSGHNEVAFGLSAWQMSTEYSFEITLKEMHITKNALESNCICGEVSNLN